MKRRIRSDVIEAEPINEPAQDVLTPITKENIRRIVRQNEYLKDEVKKLTTDLNWTSKVLANRTEQELPTGDFVLSSQYGAPDLEQVYKDFLILQDRTYQLYYLKMQDGSAVPIELQQRFTGRERAKHTIDQYLIDQKGKGDE